MKPLLARLGVASLVIGALLIVAWYFIERAEKPRHTARDPRSTDKDAREALPQSASSVASERRSGAQSASRPRMSGVSAAAALQQIGEVSQRLMPDGYRGIFIGMPLADLRAVRGGIHRGRESSEGREIWEEDDPNGARVVYFLSTHGLLEQVQFMSRLDAVEELGPHFTALQRRYGAPTGVWDCPETEEAPPLRRITWRREGASLMEAVLMYGRTISVTLVVAPTEDIGAALQRSRCSPVQGPEQLAQFPVARELRGERSTFIREIRRDGGR